MTTKNLDQLEAAADVAAARAAAARAAAADARAAEHARREARRVQHARLTVENYDPQGLEEDAQTARARFEQAALDSPLIAAWIDYKVAAHRRYMQWTEAQAQAAQAGVALPRTVAAAATGELVEKVELLERLIDQAAGARLSDERDAHEAWREEWIAGNEPHPLDGGGASAPLQPPPVDQSNWTAAGKGQASGHDVAKWDRR
jgi:hypothetical protein